MEKISGILPTSKRISQVDQSLSPSIRPGAPHMGAHQTRPLATNLTNEGLEKTTAQKAVEAHKELMSQRSAQSKEALEVQKLADQFFMSRVSGSREPIQSELNVSAIENLIRPQNMSFNDRVIGNAESTLGEEFIAELTPPGAYLDRWA